MKFPLLAITALWATLNLLLVPSARADVSVSMSNRTTLDTRSGLLTLGSADVPKTIADNATVTSSLTVSDLVGTIADVNVSLDITHTRAADLTVRLRSPQGTWVQLFANVGGSGANFTATVLDDEAATAIASGAAPFTGSFRPAQALTAFDGQTPNGTWTLEISDNASGNTGTLNNWSLRFDAAPYTYTTANGKVTITEYTGPGGDVTIPGTIDGLPVTAIGEAAFVSSTSLTSVTIPDSVTSIGDDAFFSCTSLTSVTLPNSVTSIGNFAFFECTSLTSARIPNSITSIGDAVFYDCTNLTSAIFLGNAPVLGWGVFDSTATSFTVNYYTLKTGFTSPTWEGYPAVNLGLFPGPDIVVEQPAGTSLAGRATRDFGPVAVGNAASKVFTIRNTGGQQLTGLVVSKDGANSGEFTVGPLGSTSLATGASTTFEVTFTPAASGPRNAAIHIASNDPDQNPFDINLTNTGMAADVNLMVVVKAQQFEQTGADLVALRNWDQANDDKPLFFEVFAEAAALDSLVSGTVQLPGGATVPLARADTALWLVYQADTMLDLNTASPDGTYTLNLITSNDGVKNISLSLTGDTYPNVPKITNFTALQAVTITVATTVQWSAMTGGTTSDFIMCSVFDSDTGDPVYETAGPGAPGALNGTAVQTTIPANALLPGRTYDAEVLFLKVTSSDNTYAGALAGYSKNVNFKIQTTALPGVALGAEFESSIPQSQSWWVARDSAIAFRFTQPMLPLQSIDWTSNELPLNPANFTYQWIDGGRVLLCRYNSTLPADAEIAWILDLSEFSDAAGIPLGGSSYGSFHTSSDPVLSPPDVTGIYLRKMRGFRQTGASAVSTGMFGCDATAEMTAYNRVKQAALTVVANGYSGELVADAWTEQMRSENTYASKEDLDRFFANGDFKFDLTTLADGVKSVTLSLGATDDYPAAPTVTNLAALQAINSATPVTITWDALTNWSATPSAGSGMIELEITNSQGEEVLWVDNSQFTSNSQYIIPADTLVPGMTYSLSLYFSRIKDLDVTSYPGAMAGSGFASVTEFTIQTAAPPVAPAIAVEQPIGTTLTSGSCTVSFEANYTGVAVPLTFTIKNTGTAPLTGIAVTKDGANAADYALTTAPATSVAAGGSTTFVVTLTPSVTGTRVAALHIASNDPTHNPFDINLTGTGLTPYTYTINQDDTITITGYNGPGGAVSIPGMIDGLAVTRIESWAFYFQTSLTGLTIPDSVTSIGDYAFAYCIELTGITIPDSVTSIGYGAFESCTSLTGITIPNEVTSIGDWTFAYCASLAGVTIPNGVTSIGDYAFAYCIDLTGITIPNGVTSIGDWAFAYCTSLTGVTIPQSVTTISYGNDWTRAFYGCTGLTAIMVDPLNSVYSSLDGVLFNKNQTTLIQCPGGKAGSYTIPNSVTSIGWDAFSYCTSLTYVTIGNAVTSIDWDAFSYCTSLTGVMIGSSVTSIDGGAFNGCSSLAAITVDPLNSFYSSLDGVLFDKSLATLIQCPPGKAGSYIIPSSVTGISYGAFDECIALTSITIPNSITDIGDWVFYNCTGLTSVTIPNSVTRIGYGAFYGCSGLASVTIPASVTSIGDEAFYDCSGLASASFMGNAPSSMGGGVFDFTASGFTVYYYNGRAGFTSPTWNGYPTVNLGLFPGPDIALEQPAGTSLADAGTTDFGTVVVGNSASKVFTIRNTGGQELTGLAISKDGANSGEFTVGALGATTLASGASTTFSVTFTPTVTGTRTAVLHIASNDADQNPFDINLTGTGTAAPEIAVEQPVGTDLTDGGAGISFGGVNCGSASSAFTFMVKNTGTTSLTGLVVSKDGSNAADFTVGSLGAATLTPGTSTSFTITFGPAAAGTRTAAIHIASNDADENPFDIDLSGIGVAAEIAVEQPAGTDLTAGSASVGFGGVDLGGTSGAFTFTVRNLGTADLTGLAVSKDGTNAGDFIVGSIGATTLAPGTSTTFTISFAPAAAGTRTAALHLASNDADESPFDIGLTGICVAPEPPVAATGSPVAVSSTAATLVGAVNPRGLPTHAYFMYGLTTLYSSSTPVQNIPAGNAIVDVLAPLTGLLANATYHCRIVAVSAAGTSQGEDMSFVATAGTGTGTGSPTAKPTVTTGAYADVTSHSAELLGSVNPNEGTTVVQFEYGTTTSYGGVTGLLSVGNDKLLAAVSLPAQGLQPGTVYHYRLSASNSLGVTPGADAVFTTRFLAPAVVTGNANALSTTSVRVTGTVRARNATAAVFIDYGTNATSLTHSVVAAPTNVTADAATQVSAELTNLDQGTTYYYQVRAENSGGTGKGEVQSFDVGVLSGLFHEFPNEIAAAARQGSVSVTLTPGGIGAGWRFAGERQWRVSGSAVTGLTSGDRVLEYRPVPGYLQAPSETVVVISGAAPMMLERAYTASAGTGTGNLSVTLKPTSLAEASVPVATRARWRLFGESDAQWQDSDSTLTGLVPGEYVIESKAVAGRTTPPPVSAQVSDGATTTATITYFLAGDPVGTAPGILSFETVSTRQDRPYAYVGQITSDVGSSTGFVVRSRVVATAGHVVFDDGTLAATTGLQWYFQRDGGVHEPAPRIPRGFYLMSGYAAQRATDNSPGTSTPLSQNLDAAALYFLEDAGRGGFSGYLASDLPVNEFVTSSALKTLVGYPVDGIAPANQGRMHATPLANVTFSSAFGQTYTTAEIRSSGGNSGGPLCVQHASGVYYPAAIYLGGTAQTVVRAIDGDVVDLFGFAESSANAGVGSTGGSVTQSGTTAIGTPTLGAIKVRIEPAAARTAGAGWRVQAQADYAASEAQIDGLSPNNYTVLFATVSGFVPPTPQPVVIQGGQLTTITFTYEEIILPPVINSPNTVTGPRGQPLSYQISATNSPGFFTLLGALPAGMSFNANSGLISGTPQEAGNFAVTVGATNAGGADFKVANLTVRPLLAAQSVTVPYQQAMSYHIVSSESGDGVTHTAANLPAGLSLNAATGWISGTPAIPGVFTVPITVTRNGAAAAADLTINVTGTAPVITRHPVANKSIEYGLNTILTVEASGLPAPTFQWYAGDSGVTTSPVADATAATFTTPVLTASAKYWARASSISGSADSTATVISLLPSANANLASLTPSAGSLTPVFNAGIFSYVAAVPYAVSTITLTPTVQIAQSLVTINGVPVASGATGAPLALAVGPNVILTQVTAGTGTTTQTYTLTVTRSEAPSVTTGVATNLTDISATLHGTVIPNSPVSLRFEYGGTASYGETTLWQNVAGTASLPVQAALTGLSGDTTYHYRIVVMAGAEQFYGADMMFTTSHARPLAATGSPVGVNPTAATLIGAVNPRGFLTAVHFQYGLTTAYGSVTDPPQEIPAGSNVVDILANITGLTPGATYHYRIIATSEAGTSAGDDVSFQAISGGGTGDGVVDAPPTVTTGAVADLTTNSANLLGVVNPHEGTTFVFFEYGLTSAYGNMTVSQGIGNGNVPADVTIPVTGLLPGTVYHYRLVASNSLGTIPGLDATFTAGYFPPLVTTGTAVALSATSATLKGTVRARDTAADVWFEYGTDGMTFSNIVRALQPTVTGDVETPVNVDLPNLNGVVTYYYRVKAISPGGTGTGEVAAFQVGALRGLVQDFTREVATGDRQGELLVNLSPSGIGGWRFVGEPQWRASGVAATGLTTVDREIEYQPVSGYNQPPGETVVVVSGNPRVVIARDYYEAGSAGTGVLRVLLEPAALAGAGVPLASRAQWRLAAYSNTEWKDSGGELGGLMPGSYLVECKAVPGKNTPSPINMLVTNGETTTAGITYFPASAPSLNPPAVVPFETVSTSRNLPYAYVGQIRSGTGSHSGFVVKPRVVATCAQAVFDDATLAATSGLQWLLQRDRGTYEPYPQVPRGFYVFDGYAAQRTVEGTPGTLSIDSQNLNVAAIYFAADAGRGGFSGFLASDAGDNEFLQSAALKTLVGYPVSGIAPANQGRMHATPPVNAAFAWALGRTYTTSGIRGIGGMTGGPLCVQRDGGTYYPAGIYVGGTTRSAVRAIDSAVIDLFTRAEVSSNGGDNNTGGGITHSSFTSIGSSSLPGALKVTIEPAAAITAGAGWRLKSESSYRTSGTQKTGLNTGSYILQLKTVSGFQVPTEQTVLVNGGQLREITFNYAATLPTLEAWRLTYFGTTSNTGTAADSADPDGDGQPNLAEYTAGTHPNNAADVFKILSATKSGAVFTVTASGKAGRTYVLESNTNLGADPWTPLGSVGPLAADGPVVLSDPAAQANRGFYRLRVSVP